MKRLLIILLCLVLVLPAMACSKNKDNEIIILDGNYTEMKLIHWMVKYLVEAETNLTVTIKDEVSHVNAFNEMQNGHGDIYNGYDGTLLTTFLKLDTTDVPEGQTLYDFANQKAKETLNVHLLEKLGFNNTYALAVPEHVAEKYQLNTISDLIPVAGELTFGAEHEFFSQEGSMKYDPFVRFYGLQFKEAVQVDIGLKYTAVTNDQIQVVVVYTTDGMNRKAKLKVLEDDRNFFPEYYDALMVRSDLFDRFKDQAANLEEVLNRLAGIFTNESMAELNYAVDVEGESVETVARRFLEEKNLLKG